MKQWTAGELIDLLSTYSPDTQIYIEDADTSWLISKFEIINGYVGDYSILENTLSNITILICPCDFSQMDKSSFFNRITDE